MADNLYKALARIGGVAAPIAGLAAVVGGSFAHRFVGEQLAAEAITMPESEVIEREVKFGAIEPEDADLLRPHAGVVLTNGPQARIYADNYVLAHMKVAANQAGVADDEATYAGVGDLIAAKTRQLKQELRDAHPGIGVGEVNGLAKAEIGDPETDFEVAREIAALQVLRSENFFMGNSIRGMLLNAYGWWLVGQIARIAGAGLIAVGGVLLGIGFAPSRRHN